ncbi:CDP-diacylglycerol--glycerol-3-phosphate 3-phosphatidyltransferase [Magnetofaba australis]|uniref:CDP-diacylglycerol--glycerol-3-phosphate 3-phosphatidyltransferase n=1 Tax=Magnetofaba australis IT-1 TaxID=1434232 RepID=A0A1Y2K6T4_9PROT|nr:CDP-diacylglycerol--glycerol-3-phosphate 3-phosphatidyltransferase [Magnetofaba australis]OSM05250.1 putative CDP-diacylglycerol--glycerol-3-phosphate 3-phosphatidyltransferase [Magnetofaba australis IT-1]
MHLNLPNWLTLSRIIMIPFFVGAIYLSGDWGNLVAASLFAIAGVTDWADGYIARKQGLVSAFGKFFDPVADKLLVVAALVILLDQQRVDLVVVMVLIIREILVMALREFMAGQGSGAPVSWIGKWKTAMQMLGIGMALLQDSFFSLPLGMPGQLCLYVSAVLSVWSAFYYMRDAWDKIRP